LFFPAPGSANEDALNVRKSIGSSDFTFENALPAYVGLTNVLLSFVKLYLTTISIISLIGCA
jgi:hypothetical protein